MYKISLFRLFYSHMNEFNMCDKEIYFQIPKVIHT